MIPHCKANLTLINVTWRARWCSMAVMRNPYHGCLFLHNGKFPWGEKVEKGSHANRGGRRHLDQFPSLSGHHPGHEATNHSGHGLLYSPISRNDQLTEVQHSHASSPRRERSLSTGLAAVVLCVEVQGHHTQACAETSIATVRKFTVKRVRRICTIPHLVSKNQNEYTFNIFPVRVDESISSGLFMIFIIRNCSFQVCCVMIAFRPMFQHSKSLLSQFRVLYYHTRMIFASTLHHRIEVTLRLLIYSKPLHI